ncbi:MAG: TrbG/VirB9 family P-type conjugative transfer protein [Acidobacteria bacterium]|nr:TrbG/VirB9 family P-type conjugative transfer protein [Acidobacteriota bacterium]
MRPTPIAVLALMLVAATVSGAQTGTNPPAPSPASGIIFVDVTPDSIVTIKTAQNVVTRVALPAEAKQAICGDVFDAASGTGTFVIDRSGNDVFIKPLATKGQTNLFIKTEREVYNFDLTVVTAAQAYRVVNVNLPPYERQIAEQKAAAARDIARDRAAMESEMAGKLADRKRELEQANEETLASERGKLRAETDRRSTDLAMRRIADGVMQGFTTVAFREKRGQLDQLDVVVDDAGYVFEGRLYVKYRITNRGTGEATYADPKVYVRTGEEDRPVASVTISARGDFKVPAGQTVTGVVVFERITLERGERLLFVVRGQAEGRAVQLRLLEQA